MHHALFTMGKTWRSWTIPKCKVVFHYILCSLHIKSQGQGWTQIKHFYWCNHWNQPYGFTLGIKVEKDFFLKIYHFVALTWSQGKKGTLLPWEANLQPLGGPMHLKPNSISFISSFHFSLFFLCSCWISMLVCEWWKHNENNIIIIALLCWWNASCCNATSTIITYQITLKT